MKCLHCSGALDAPAISLGRWLVEYERLISTRPLSTKTLSGRKNHITLLLDLLGGTERPLASIRPVDIATALRKVWDSSRHYTSLRLYIEAHEVFSEAINAGYVYLNPVTHIKRPNPKPKRSRLSLENYVAIRKLLARQGKQWLIDAMDLALITGQRLGDVSTLKVASVVEDHLLVHQQKTGERLAIPLDIKLDITKLSLRKLIAKCAQHKHDQHALISRKSGKPYSKGYISTAFAEARDEALPKSTWPDDRKPATFHEIRSLSERLYRDQGIDTRALLGHKRQAMTDHYNDDRGCAGAQFKVVPIGIKKKNAPTHIRDHQPGKTPLI